VPSYDLNVISRRAAPEDNVAIATRLLPAGSLLKDTESGAAFTTDATIMEGHRFAVLNIDAGQPVLSWGLPFGIATRDIRLGEYIRNQQILEALKIRELDFDLPDDGNFEDRITPFQIDESSFVSGSQVPPAETPGTFRGYLRSGGRGAGTRNMVVIIGTTSRTGSYAIHLEQRLKSIVAQYPNIDGVVSVAHTEGGGKSRPNNKEMLLRTLAGYVIHPNVGACLVVDDGAGPVTNDDVKEALRRNRYPQDHCTVDFLTVGQGFEASLNEGERRVKAWLPEVNSTSRTDVPLSMLKIAMQCGGSDAFSGVSGNPLSAWVVREIIRHGGSANLAETDELIGAESYVLQNVKDMATARRFLDTVEWFKTLTSWHGESAEGNPSGGNKFRGLYNIVLKSIGAAMKRHPDVRLDAVIDYSEPMTDPGYYFMNSPGNDLESIAGQVASGCNLIYFVTGNGSITNFPFAPTIKFITTTARYELLSHEMDVNAGAYLDGTPMGELGAETFDLTVDVASGQITKGERAGHTQVSIWRNWQQTDTKNLKALKSAREPEAHPLAAESETSSVPLVYDAWRHNGRTGADRIGLVLPTSLCAAQVSRMAAEKLSERLALPNRGLNRIVALTHTEGCGVAGATNERLYSRTLLGHLTHPFVALGHLLEHGCEKTHNDYFRDQLRSSGQPVDGYGWASIQLDGGIDNVLNILHGWFQDRLVAGFSPERETVSIEGVRIGLHAHGALSDAACEVMATTTRRLLGAGAVVIIPETSSLLESEAYTQSVLKQKPEASLPFGLHPDLPGLYIMETPTDHWVETLTGLASAWCEVALVSTDGPMLQGHPMIPVLTAAVSGTDAAIDADIVLGPDGEADDVLVAILETLSGRLEPFLQSVGNTDFQCARGLLGISM
jgi:altronate dehydratase